MSQARALRYAPTKRLAVSVPSRSRGAARLGGGEGKAVLLVDLGAVGGRRPLALLQWAGALRGRRLGGGHRPAHVPLDRRLAGRSDRVLRLEPRLPQEATRERGDQRRIEGGKARELDTDFVAHRDLLTLSRSRSARTRASSGGSGAGSPAPSRPLPAAPTRGRRECDCAGTRPRARSRSPGRWSPRGRSGLRRRRDRSAPPAHAWRRSGVAPRAPRPRPSRV